MHTGRAPLRLRLSNQHHQDPTGRLPAACHPAMRRACTGRRERRRGACLLIPSVQLPQPLLDQVCSLAHRADVHLHSNTRGGRLSTQRRPARPTSGPPNPGSAGTTPSQPWLHARRCCAAAAVGGRANARHASRPASGQGVRGVARLHLLPQLLHLLCARHRLAALVRLLQPPLVAPDVGHHALHRGERAARVAGML